MLNEKPRGLPNHYRYLMPGLLDIALIVLGPGRHREGTRGHLVQYGLPPATVALYQAKVATNNGVSPTVDQNSPFSFLEKGFVDPFTLELAGIFGPNLQPGILAHFNRPGRNAAYDNSSVIRLFYL